MTAIHIPTVFLIIGLLYLVLPIVGWLVLADQASETAKLWCLGSGVLAAGLLLIGARGQVPAWMTYPLANALSWMGILMQALALRRALDRTWPWSSMALTVGVWLGVFEYFRWGVNNQDGRFAWATLFFVVVFSYIASLAWRISHEQSLKSGRWLSGVYALAALMLSVRMVRVLFNMAEPDAVAQGMDSVLTVAIGILISVLGTFTFVSMFLERATQRELRATERRVRQEESVRLGEQIAQLDRARTLGAMSYSLAHELSQPLTAILMDAHAIKSQRAANPQSSAWVQASIEAIEQNANRISVLIDRIRQFIRPSSGDFEWVDMKVLVKEVRGLLLHDIRQHHIVFTWTFDEEPCGVVGDKVQLSQIILNMYRNAVQALVEAAERRIEVALERQADRVVVRVRDTGPGVSESIKSQVGDAFVTDKPEGLGLGLAISKTIADKHSGQLTITNAVGGGALVELNLPAAAV